MVRVRIPQALVEGPDCGRSSIAVKKSENSPLKFLRNSVGSESRGPVLENRESEQGVQSSLKQGYLSFT